MLKVMSSIIFVSLMVSLPKAFAECTVAVTVGEAITASTSDYLSRAEKTALERKCSSLLVRINTAGGSLQSTRLIVEKILASPVPYLCLITPRGGHAGSAGAIILQACHVNGGLAATNLGAATPILGSGQEMSPDLRKKLINDTVSWLEGITKLRKRNVKFSKEIVTEAVSLSSEQAVKENALDILATDEADFLTKAKARKVAGAQSGAEIEVGVGALYEFSPDLRYKVLGFVADPEFAYLLFMGSLALLYFEITNPGLMAPGVIGGIGLVLSLVAFHKLEIMWGGLALIMLGIAFLILEIFVTSFGILAIGGLAAIFFGSLFLFDTQATGYSLPLSLIFAVVGVLGTFFFGIGLIVVRSLRLKNRDMDTELKSRSGKVVTLELDGHTGQIEIMGETWAFISKDKLALNDLVSVESRQGLTLTVKKET